MSTDPSRLADQLLAKFDLIRPFLSYAVIVELRQRVEDHKFQDPVRALEIADTAEMAATALADPAAEALAAWAKATALLFNGRVNDALPYYRQAEQRYVALAQPIAQVGVQAPLVYALNASGETTAALALAMQVQAHCHQLGDPARQALAHVEMNLGTIRKQQGAFAASLAACDRAKLLFLALGDAEGAARAELNRANVLQEMDRFAEAAQAYAAARLPLHQSQRNRQQVALIDFNLGLLAERRGRYVDALRYLEAAHDEFTPIVHQAATNLNRALIYHRLNLPAEAVQLAQRAHAIFAANAMIMDEGHALLMMGRAADQLGHPAEAQTYLQQAVAHFAKQEAAFWQATAQLALAQTYQPRPGWAALPAPSRQRAERLHDGNVTASYDLATAVQAQADQAEWPTLAVDARLTLVRLALLTPQSSAERTIDLLQESITIANRDYLALHALESYALLGCFYQQQHAHSEARVAYLQAIALLEEIRAALQIDELQLGYLADKAYIYAAAATLFSAVNGSPQEQAMLLYLLNLAAVAPLPLPENGVDAMADPETAHLRQELRRLQEIRQWQQHKVTDPATSLSSMRTTLAQLEREIRDCWRRIRVRGQSIGSAESGPGCSNVSATLEPRALAFGQAIQEQLQPDEALLVYAEIQGQLHVLLMRPTTSAIIPLGDWQAIEKRLATWRFHINDHQLIHQQPALAQSMAQRILATFYQSLFAPLATHLDGCTHLYLTLPPPFHDLPFAAFWEEGYLLERYQLTHLTAPEALLHECRLSMAALSAQPLIIGHSHGGQLPHAVPEATAIADTFGCDQTQTLLCETAATADAFLAAAPAATLIHIAAHAHFASNGPLFSAIQLADRELSVIELYHSALLRRHPLVVLSTCVSGQGQARGGGLLGLARAFFASGAGELLVTVWQVDDRSTADLMSAFYQQLLHEPHRSQSSVALRSVALRSAQLRAAATLHPFHWAGFFAVKG